MPKNPIAEAYFATIDTSLFDSSEIVEEWEEPVLVLTSKTVVLKFAATVNPDATIHICGTTNYLANGTWYTFDRRGIEDSFYSDYDSCATKWDVETVILEQIERAEKSIARHEAKGNMIELFPGINVFESDIANKIDEFKENGYISFTPSGMGIGYRITRNRVSRWDSPLSGVALECLGFKNAWVETLDCD